MDATTIGVDLAKNVFQLAIVSQGAGTVRRERLSRARFLPFFSTLSACHVVMEACGSAHHFGRRLQAQGHRVSLLPAQYTRAYVRRNKTDAADAAALVEAARCPQMQTVPLKSLSQQALLQLHRLRAKYQRTRTSRINQLRGMAREFGIALPLGLPRARVSLAQALSAPHELPELLHPWIQALLEEIDQLQDRVKQIDRTFRTLARKDALLQRLQQAPGVGLLTVTALVASVGEVQRFASGRRLSSWMGLTAREHSSAEHRRLGGISKQGDRYLRTLLVHGARSALTAALRAHARGEPLDRLRQWAVATEQRCGMNKATVALANKLVRILWAMWRYERGYEGDRAFNHH
jgi:transposase